MKTASKWISKALEFIVDFPRLIGFLALIAMGSVVVSGVFARYVVHRPLHFVDEYSGYLNAALIILPLGWVTRHVGHLNLDIVIKVLPKRFVKYLEIVTTLISLGVVVILTIVSAQLVMKSFASNAKSWSIMETPLGPVQLVMPIGFGIFALQIVVEIVNQIRGRRTHQDSAFGK